MCWVSPRKTARSAANGRRDKSGAQCVLKRITICARSHEQGGWSPWYVVYFGRKGVCLELKNALAEEGTGDGGPCGGLAISKTHHGCAVTSVSGMI